MEKNPVFKTGQDVQDCGNWCETKKIERIVKFYRNYVKVKWLYTRSTLGYRLSKGTQD